MAEKPLYPPACFDAWVVRVGSGRVSGHPDAWRTQPGLVIDKPARIAVLLHVYYTDLLPEMLEQLTTIPVDFDLIVTNSSGQCVDVPSGLGRMRNSRVFEIENRGRDIWPTLAVVNSGILDPYLLILKLHTKKSEWRAEHATLGGDGEQWRQHFLDQLLGSTDNVSGILDAFAVDPSLGVVTAEGSVLGADYWGDNEQNTAELARRLELTLLPEALQFPAGSVYWCRGLVLQGLRALVATEADFEPEAGQVNGTVAHAVERLIGIVTMEAGLQIQERHAVRTPVGGADWQRYDGRDIKPRARFVPFYLPQFHPIPENDRWWGKGFTEWTNVTAARPVYHGHYQPKLPTDMGFYDLRNDEVRAAQAELASFAGIEGFMYYYYWFAGERLLSRPIEALRESELAFPFCIMWANENWTRRWDGNNSDILLAQNYSRVPASRFIDDVAEFLSDRRYMTIDDKKVLAVYRPAQMENFPAVAQQWRDRARQLGLGDLYLLHVDVGQRFDGLEGANGENGLDGSLGFPPHNMTWSWVDGSYIGARPGFAGNGLSYPAMVEDAISAAWRELDRDHYPGAMVTFDNTPRRPMASDFWYGSNPYTFRRWVAALASAVADRERQHRVIFLNAWNEWAEGAVLEPNDRHGRSYLLAVRDVALS